MSGCMGIKQTYLEKEEGQHSLTQSSAQTLWRMWYIAIVCMCGGYFCKAVFQSGDVINGFLFLVADWDESSAALTEQLGIAVVFVLTVLTWWKPFWWAATALTMWLVALALITYAQSTWHPWIIPIAQATRIGLPIMVVMAVRGGRYPQNQELICACRFLIAATFIGHGIEALLLRGNFIDMITRTCGYEMFTQSQTSLLLQAIGVLDIIVALLLLLPLPLRILRMVALWMACWGALTAMARIFAVSPQGYSEMLIRVPHAILPLSLYFYWSKIKLLTMSPNE